MKIRFLSLLLAAVILAVSASLITGCENNTGDEINDENTNIEQPPVTQNNDDLLYMNHILTMLRDGIFRMGIPDEYTEEYTNSIALYSYVQAARLDEYVYFDYTVPRDADGDYNDFYRLLFGKDSTFPNINVGPGAHGISTADDSYLVSPGAFSGGSIILILEVQDNCATVIEYTADGNSVFSRGSDASTNEYASIEEMTADSSDLQKWVIEFERTDTSERFHIKDIKKL